MKILYLFLVLIKAYYFIFESSSSSFDSYLYDYQLEISDQNYSYREQMYNQKRLQIEDFNNREEQLSWKEGVNQFSIMSQEEREMHLGLDPRDELMSYLQEDPQENQELISFTKFMDMKNDSKLRSILPAQALQIQSYSRYTHSEIYEEYQEYDDYDYYYDGRRLNEVTTNNHQTDLFNMMKQTQYYNSTSQIIEKDWHKEDKVTSVKHQGKCKAGWAFAALAAIESMYKIYNNTTLNLSEQQLIDCTLIGCDGGWQEVVYNQVQKNTAQLEEDYQYMAKPQVCKSKDPTSIKIHDFQYIQYRDMYDYLNKIAQGPVSSNIYISDAFFDYSKGIIDTEHRKFCPNQENFVANHAVLAVGFKIDLKNPKNSYIKFKNSWGTLWGEEGYFRVKLRNIRHTKGPCEVISQINNYKVNPMENKKKPHNKQKIETDYEDFFTVFLQQRQKNYLKKKTKIENLEQKNKDELTIEQKHLVENKQKTLDKIQSFDDMRQLYLQAINKKMPELLKQQNAKAALLEIELKDNDLLQDSLNLYHLGNSTKKGDTNCLDFLTKKNLGIEFQENLQTQFDKVFENESYDVETRNQNFKSLQEYLKDREMVKQVNSVVSDENFGKKIKEEGEEQEEEKEQSKKGIFFGHSDDEDSEQEQEEEQQGQNEQDQDEEDDEFKFKKMPIDSDHEDEFVNNNRGRGGQRGSYNKRGQRGSRGQRGQRGNRGGYGDRDERGGQRGSYNRRGQRGQRGGRGDRGDRGDRGNMRGRGNRRGKDNYRGNKDYYNKRDNQEYQKQDNSNEQSSQ